MEYVIGIILGIIISAMWAVLITVRGAGLNKVQLKKMIDEAEKVGSIKYRYTLTEEMSKMQMELLQKLQQPSKGAAHSKWKNDLIKEVENIENEKIDIFRTMVADGVDPMMNFAGPNGQGDKLRMSEAIARHDNRKDTNVPPLKKKTDSKSSREKTTNVIDFNSYRKEKNNGNKPSNPAPN